MQKRTGNADVNRSFFWLDLYAPFGSADPDIGGLHPQPPMFLLLRNV